MKLARTEQSDEQQYTYAPHCSLKKHTRNSPRKRKRIKTIVKCPAFTINRETHFTCSLVTSRWSTVNAND